MKLIPSLICDFYKISHRNQYPTGTESVYSTWVPRSNKHLPYITEATVFGIQGFINELHDLFDREFFSKSLVNVISEYTDTIKKSLSVDSPDTSHVESLHALGYLPIEIKSLDEGSSVPMRTPIMTVENTLPEFYWLTNYLETAISANLWKPSTTASIARHYRTIFEHYAEQTCDDNAMVPFQGHDFSMRGMSGVEDAARSGAGHLLSFWGTDTIPAIHYLEKHYQPEKDILIGCSVPATEHSVMCAGGQDDELETYRRLIEDIYPTGIISIVSDTWDFWHVVTDTLPKLKDKIMQRDGKVVIRPDSGDPYLIIVGDKNAPVGSPENKGLIECLFETFGGRVNTKGYTELDAHIGAIYGDSITTKLADRICDGLMRKGFASNNVVFGIGSFTYQYLTRDSLGYAMKATSVVINGERKAIFKNPKTDDGTKKSNKGRVKVFKNEIDGKYYVTDESTGRMLFDDSPCDMKVRYVDGKKLNQQTLGEIRENIRK